ncbi:MAG: threonylcarbamoyl-AMP synthase [Gemmatimonadetes bacterium]|nr:threonylcarbamoyl-AMP synthase [Gemmatimonadota bacterium]
MSGLRVVPFRTAEERAPSVEAVAGHLRAGGLVAYPTETVYGFGCLLRADALERLAALKARDERRPFLLLVRSAAEVKGATWTDAARRLADAFWPGPLTLALAARPGRYPRLVLGPGDTVAVRASPHPAVRDLLAALGEPITSTSANRPGEPAALDADAARRAAEALGAGAEMLVLDGGPLPASPPSTLVDVSSHTPRILRRGALSVASLRAVLPEIDDGA